MNALPISTLPTEILFPIQFLVQNPFDPTAQPPLVGWFRTRLEEAIKTWESRQCGVFSWNYDAKNDTNRFFADLDKLGLDPVDPESLRDAYAPAKGRFVAVHIGRESSLAQLPKGCIVPSPAAMIMLAASYMHMMPDPALHGTHFWFPIDEAQTEFQISVTRNKPGSAFCPLEVRLSHSGRVTQENSVNMVYAVVWKTYPQEAQTAGG